MASSNGPEPTPAAQYRMRVAEVIGEISGLATEDLLLWQQELQPRLGLTGPPGNHTDIMYARAQNDAITEVLRRRKAKTP
jgi:hypothetical protein